MTFVILINIQLSYNKQYMSALRLRIQSKKNNSYKEKLRKVSSERVIEIKHEDEELNQINKLATLKNQQVCSASLFSEPLMMQKGNSLGNLSIHPQSLLRVQSAFQTSQFKRKRILMKLAEMGFAPQLVDYVRKQNKISFEVESQEEENYLIMTLSYICAEMQTKIAQPQRFNQNLKEIPVFQKKGPSQKSKQSEGLDQFDSSKNSESAKNFQSIKSEQNIKNLNSSKSDDWIDFSKEEKNDCESKKSQEKQADEVRIQIQLPNQQENPPSNQCLICLDDVSQNYFTLPQCRHTFCESCVDAYLKNCIMTSQIEVIKCPFDGCKEQYSEEVIQQIVSIEMWNKFLLFKHYKEVDKNPNARWCPKIVSSHFFISFQGCTNHVIAEPNSTLVHCVCGQAICFKCGNQYHEGLSCEQALDKNYLEAVKKFTIKGCPKCAAPIQKSSGCNHMTCFKCNYQFCWLCGVKYTKYHYKSINPLGCSSCDGQFDTSEPCIKPKILRVIYFIPRLICILLLLPIWIIKNALKALGASLFCPWKTLKQLAVFNKMKKSCKNCDDDCWCFFKCILKLFLCLFSLLLLPIVFVFFEFPKRIIKFFRNHC